MVDERIVSGVLTGTGALLYNLWGLYNAWVKTFNTPVQEVWDWRLTVSSLLPSVCLGFMAGYQMSPDSAVEYLALISSGFGIASAQNKAGFESFFR